MAQEIAKMTDVNYDVDVSEIHRQPDLTLLETFVQSEHKNMVITYEDKYECKKRRACLRTWLIKNGYFNILTNVRDNKLYIIKEQKIL